MTIEFIENPANQEKVEAASILSDIHKDVYGFRPRGMYNIEAMTVAEINAEIAVLCEESKAVQAEEEYVERLRVEEFKALVDKTIKLGANDEKTALKWLFEASDSQDIEGFIWSYGFLHNVYGREIVAKLNDIYGY